LDDLNGLETEAEGFRSEEGVEDMTGKEIRVGRVTWKGWVPDTDPRYGSGWNFLVGKNLNQPSGTKSREATPPNKEGEAAQIKQAKTGLWQHLL
jgi:hypothetical protein